MGLCLTISNSCCNVSPAAPTDSAACQGPCRQAKASLTNTLFKHRESAEYFSHGSTATPPPVPSTAISFPALQDKLEIVGVELWHCRYGTVTTANFRLWIACAAVLP